MSRQDKATTERHAKTLREMLKRPENKVCADCKRNDPRWASWNIGVFLCIRCSGIHRSMGTHISKVKSVDLDVWTPEQMASIQKWGNRLANSYWEAHLRPGHIPADHKMDSFIRSKYESRRWAMEGPPPSDPTTLDTEAPAASAPAPTTAAQLAAPIPPPARTQTPVESLVTASASRSSITTRQPQPHQLLSASVVSRNNSLRTAAPTVSAPSAPQVQPVSQPKPGPADELFSLDFHARSSTGTPVNNASARPGSPPKKDVKQDILSLFSAPPKQTVVSPVAAAGGGFGHFAQVQSDWGAFGSAPAQPVQQQSAQPTSMVGSTGVGMWGVSSGWSAPPAVPAQPSLWGAPAAQPAVQQQSSLFTTSDVWGSSGAAGGNDLFGSAVPASATATTTTKKDDVFGDIWGSFK